MSTNALHPSPIARLFGEFQAVVLQDGLPSYATVVPSSVTVVPRSVATHLGSVVLIGTSVATRLCSVAWLCVALQFRDGGSMLEARQRHFYLPNS